MLRLVHADGPGDSAAPSDALSDDKALTLLPPVPLARAAYRSYRERGATPTEALLTALQECAAPRRAEAA